MYVLIRMYVHTRIHTYHMFMYIATVRVEHLADIKFGDLGENTGWLNQLRK